MTLSGWWGSSKEIKLAKPGKTSHKFNRNTQDTFELMADDVGPLSSITVS